MWIKNEIRTKVRKFPAVKNAIQEAHRLLLKTPILGRILFENLWSTELDLLKGKSISNSNKKSIIHFSVNRAASQFIKRILKIITEKEGLVHVNWNAMASNSEYPYMNKASEEEIKRYKKVYQKKGYLYSPYGGYIENVPKLRDFRTLITVRDPRDVCVSRYYSRVYSHMKPVSDEKRKKFFEQKEEMKRKGIDKWVVEEAEKVKRHYLEYHNNIDFDSKNVHVNKFEEMASDFEKWLNVLVKNLNIETTKKIRKKAIKLNNKNKPKKEDKYNRNRKGKSGDYMNKLNEKTIIKMNNKLGRVLDIYNY